MITNQWYAILDAKEVKRKKPIGVTRMNQRLVLWRDETGKVQCINDRCCHRGASLALGEVVDSHVACPFHGFEYDGSGKVVVIPANGHNQPVEDRFKVHSFTTVEAYDLIWVYYTDEIPDKPISVNQLPPIPFFEELTDGFTYGGFKEQWNVHYTRAIENQLDVVHLPFVHKTTIGRGNNTLVNGPVIKWDKNRMTFYVKNVLDQGQKPEKPDEIKNPEKLFSLQLQMPNLWQNRISDKIRIMAVFAPIDEENTMIYLRFYQKFMTLPVLGSMINGLSRYMNGVILHQDRRVVLTQEPKKSELRMKELLIQGDLPIIEFRKKRDQLKKQSESLPIKE